MQIASAFRLLGSNGGLKGQVLRGGLGSIAVRIGSILANLAATIVLARLLGPEQFGIYTFVIAIIALLTIPAQFGLPNLVVRETAKAHAEEDWARMKGIWRWSNVVAAATSGALIVLVIGIISLPAVGLSGENSNVLILALPLIPLLALGNLRGAALRGLRLVVLGQLPEQVLRHGFLAGLAILVSLFVIRAPTASDAVLYNTVASGLAFIVGAVLLARNRPSEAVTESNVTFNHSGWFSGVVPLALIGGMQVVGQNVGVIVLGIFQDPEGVGLFRVAMQGAMLVTFGLAAANQVIAPFLARLYAQGDLQRMQHLVTGSTTVVSVIATVVFIFCVCFGQTILSILFGANFSAAETAFLIMAGGQLVSAFAGSVGLILSMTGHASDTAKLLAATLVINVVANIALVPLFGINGAAMATAITVVVQNISLLFLVRFRIGIRPSIAACFTPKRPLPERDQKAV